MDLKIPESWVETIEQFADDEADGDLADGSEAINLFGTADISKKNLKSYEYTDAEVTAIFEEIERQTQILKDRFAGKKAFTLEYKD